MRINIKPINSKQREIVNHVHEYIDAEADYFLYSTEQTTKEWDENEDSDDIENLIKSTTSERIINRSTHLKIKINCIKGIQLYWSEANERWAVALLTNIADEIDMVVLFEEEDEAMRVFSALDKWLFEL